MMKNIDLFCPPTCHRNPSLELIFKLPNPKIMGDRCLKNTVDTIAQVISTLAEVAINEGRVIYSIHFNNEFFLRFATEPTQHNY